MEAQPLSKDKYISLGSSNVHIDMLFIELFHQMKGINILVPIQVLSLTNHQIFIWPMT